MYEQFEYLVIDNGFMSTNRTGAFSLTDESMLGNKLTKEYGRLGWKLVTVVGDDFIFIRPLQEQKEAKAKPAQKVKSKKAATANDE